MPKSVAPAAIRSPSSAGERNGAPLTDHVDLTDYRPITPQEKALLTAMLHSTTPTQPSPSSPNSKRHSK